MSHICAVALQNYASFHFAFVALGSARLLLGGETMKWSKTLTPLLVIFACGPNHSQFGDQDGGNDGSNNGDGGPCLFCGDTSTPSDGAPPCISDPGNYDIPGNNCDDDGDGIVDNPPACDTGLSGSGPASSFASAIELCSGTKPAVADSTHWGVVSAGFTQGYGSTAAPDAHQTSILSTFGNTVAPRAGKTFAVLSSGYAQAMDGCPTSQRFSNLAGTQFKFGCAMTTQGMAPSGFPKSATGCPSQAGSAVNDVVDLQIVIQVPKNANGFSFDFDFGSGEWPEYVCSPFNDSFIAYLKTPAFNSGTPDNISFDSMNNPVSVNNAFFGECGPANAKTGCAPQATAGMAACSGGTADLMGTGFYDLNDSQNPYVCNMGSSQTGGGMTGWLTTQAPASPWQQMTIDLIIWDTGDQYYDSSVILDNWQWKPAPVTVGTMPN
jgi:hypothetical protein